MNRFWRALLVLLTAATSLSGGDGATARIVVSTANSGVSTPTEPVAGYATWFVASEGTYSDAGCSAQQTTDGGAVNCWQSKGGSYGTISVKVPGGYGAPSYEENEINGHPAIKSEAASFELLRDAGLDTAIFEGGILQVGQGTVFAVVKVATINGTSRDPWGDNNGYLATILRDNSGDQATAFLYDGGNKAADKPITEAAAHVLTWHHEGGALYSGVDDTRTSSMSTVSAGDMDTAAGYLVVAGGTGPGAYLDGDLAELVFYKTALSEADRKLTERYLAAKYAVTIPY